MRRLTRILVGGAALWAASVGSTPARADTQSPYQLGLDSSFESGCFAMCDCLVERDGLSGTFDLRFVGFDGLFDHYEVANVDWTIQRSTQPILITGSGTYRIGGEFAIQQQLELDLALGGSPPQRFDSGLVVGGSGFPGIDILVSLHGMLTCTDSVIHVAAKPQDLSALGPEGTDGLPPRAAPNPFQDRTDVLLRLGRGASVDLRVYDVRGRAVRTLLAHTMLGPGLHPIPWDGRNDEGVVCAAGVYVVRVLVDGHALETAVVKTD